MSRGTEKRGCLVLRFWWVEVGCLLGDAIGRCILSLGVKKWLPCSVLFADGSLLREGLFFHILLSVMQSFFFLFSFRCFLVVSGGCRVAPETERMLMI